MSSFGVSVAFSSRSSLCRDLKEIELRLPRALDSFVA